MFFPQNHVEQVIQQAGFPQVQVGEECPAVVSPTKPKFYLLGDLTIPAGQAVKLK